MTRPHRTFSPACCQAMEHVLAHYFDDERRDYRSAPRHERSLTHIYHSLRIIRRELRRPSRQLDIHAVLESRGAIAIVWSIEDVLGVRPHLSKEQAWNVLQRCEKVHDCNYGMTWDLLESVADDLYPAPGADEAAK
ncbi:MAG TPA: hypothetical protein PKC18_03960 [Lacipirellulaceae bacterium]|nr:hypothetical protein [Lacipirellulaceae bacterium]HMP04729.1 hypothetical protein [Lacipirellulaceae bacterium]